VARSRRVASVNDIPPGKRIVVEVDSKKIVLFNIKGNFYAIDNTCPHRGGPLGEGSQHGTTVNCPWHGAQFDVTSGRVLGPPASTGVASYSTRVEEGGIWVTLS
jgi:nitrite reductase (NADH) small subunit/3-phenylpropionate/trans-cinnamate dioxygenase ferredoxin subunit